MTGTILTIAQQKGGAGKTTLTAQLAVALSKTGASVATIDIDPQKSLSGWMAQRTETLGQRNRITHTDTGGWRLKKGADTLAMDYDYVLIDSPPHGESEASIAIRAADMVLIPIQPSPMDLWACKATLEIAEKEGTEPFIILNRVDARTRLSGAMRAKIAKLPAKLAKQTLGNRVAYASSMLDGLGVIENEPHSPAAHEIEHLCKELKVALKASQKAKKAA